MTEGPNRVGPPGGGARGQRESVELIDYPRGYVVAQPWGGGKLRKPHLARAA